MSFQVSNTKSHNFIDLLDKNSNSIKLYITKGDPWLKFFSYSNSLYVRAIRAIVNHALIGEY